ncbi:PLP-dependent cysteine synthase family protein [Actinomadura verrucosospora]|uniref:Pyridoxal-5'-phosphate-dependent protein subunit beta n=1 Tax=Actinomadura verrucosospora TaxID=46165 RepID=A0A7D3VTS6_ACTVE|nr:pyridoxal-phosphate dependent enzyme [Actinomadura verrucosospora]QKG23035.1 pyridoxal-5'-phosphate-dependent protein subunit beta [Actinomadura verrucosospora]
MNALEILAAEERRGPAPRLHAFPLPAEWGVTLHLLDESVHPTGSLKHRTARAMFRHALRTGRIREGTTIVEATGGNAAVAEAYFARLLGLPFVAVMPRRSSPEKIERIEQYGGTCRLVHPPLAIYDEARRFAEECGGYYMDYLANGSRAVAAEGEDDVGRVLLDRVTPEWVVVGAGSGATSTAIGREIRRRGLDTQLAIADPENSAYFPGWALGVDDYATGMPPRIEGIGRPRMEAGFTPSLVDLVVPVPDAASVAGMRILQEVAGLRAGPSTGTALWAAFQLAAKMCRERRVGAIAMLICDDGALYENTYCSEAWLDGKGLNPLPWVDAFGRFLETAKLPLTSEHL